MTTATIDVSARPALRAQRLMEATREAHDGLDARIMSADPFRDRATGIGQQSPRALQQGMADARAILAERGLLGREHAR